MRYRRLIATSATVFLFAFCSLYPATGATPTNADAKKRFAYCGTFPNGATLIVVETTRLIIKIPKDLFPNIKLTVTSHGAIAGALSNLGAYGYAFSRDAKPDCWSYFFDFERTPNNKTQSGTVDIGSKSAYKTVSNYLIHFKVVVKLPSATKQLAGNGTVLGHVVLGPVCPVEHIPPDPACAPKPYKTFIHVWSALTGSSYQSVSTDALGSFKLSLAPGAYSLEVTPATGGSPYPRCNQVNISVIAKETQNLTFSCDTGIR